MRLVRWDYNRLLGRTQSCWNEDLEEFFHTVCSHLTNFNKSPLCLRALRGRPPRNGANSRCQASYKWGEKWFGWNLTNQTSSYDPALNQVLWWMNLASFPSPASFLLLAVPYILQVTKSWLGPRNEAKINFSVCSRPKTNPVQITAVLLGRYTFIIRAIWEQDYSEQILKSYF